MSEATKLEDRLRADCYCEDLVDAERTANGLEGSIGVCLHCQAAAELTTLRAELQAAKERAEKAEAGLWDGTFLVAMVSQGGRVVSIDHPSDADWNDVFRAHVVLRDRLIERIAAQSGCPARPVTAQSPAVTDEMVERVKRKIAGVETPMMEGDNLAVVLCSVFDNPDQEPDDDCGWTPDALAGYEEVIDAIARAALEAR